jgi:outer membrane protein assembly factor BamA
MIRFLFLSISLLMVFCAYAQRTKKLIDFEKERKFVALPSIYYTPETNWAFGAAAIGFFRFQKNDTLSPISNASVSMAYTLNDQILFQLPFNLYFKSDSFRLLGELDFYRYPYFFSGIGNERPLDYFESYSASFPRFQLIGLQKVWKNVFTGPRIYLQNTTVSELEAGGELESGNVPGYQGGVTNAMGWDIRIDSRNNVYGPTQGHYLRGSMLFYDRAFLSDFEYNHLELDLRKYFNLGSNHVLAIQSYSEFNFGTVPFNRMAQLGGHRIMRGYKKGTFRDQLYTAAQIEYRSPIWYVFGFTAFVGTGTVSDQFQNMNLDYFRPTYGGGLRVAFNKKERIHIRIDYARGDHYDEFYLTLGEAF